MSDKPKYSGLHFLSPYNPNPRFEPDWGPRPAGAREVVTISINGKEIDEIKGTWQEDGTIVLDRGIDNQKFAWFLLGDMFEQPSSKPSDAQEEATERQQPRCEPREQEAGYVGSKATAIREAEEGADFVRYRYYRKNRRVLVRRHLLQDDFDGTYDRVCAYLGEAPVVVLEEEDFVHFRERGGK